MKLKPKIKTAIKISLSIYLFYFICALVFLALSKCGANLNHTGKLIFELQGEAKLKILLGVNVDHCFIKENAIYIFKTKRERIDCVNQTLRLFKTSDLI